MKKTELEYAEQLMAVHFGLCQMVTSAMIAF